MIHNAGAGTKYKMINAVFNPLK